MSNWLDLIQTLLLMILVDRKLILRDRYKFAIENHISQQYSPYWAFWIYCKKKEEDYYWRSGGKRLIMIRFKEKK